MNVTALIAAVRLRTGTLSTDAQLTDANLILLINAANAHIGSIHDWPWQQKSVTTLTTVSGTAEYTPPADWLRTVSLRVTSPNLSADSMTLYEVDELDDRWPSSARGEPSEYAIFGEVLRLGPTPDGVYTVRHRYVTIEPALTAGNNTPIMPAQFHDAIAEYAAHLGCRMISEETRAQAAMVAFDRWIASMQNDRRRSTSPMRVRVRPGSLI